MHGRLSTAYGWYWVTDGGIRGPFVLTDIHRYAGMVAGYNPEGRLCTRPLIEFDAFSLDGILWQPAGELRPLIPWEGNHVRERILRLPESEI